MTGGPQPVVLDQCLVHGVSVRESPIVKIDLINLHPLISGRSVAGSPRCPSPASSLFNSSLAAPGAAKIVNLFMEYSVLVLLVLVSVAVDFTQII